MRIKHAVQWRSRLSGAAFVGAIALTACGNNVVEYRNAQIVNGKVYAGNADEPFSGRLANLPVGQLSISSPGFFKAANLIDGAQQNFKGQVPGSLCDVGIKAGLLHGKAVCKLPQSDIVLYEMTFEKGTLEGELRAYAPTKDNDQISSVSFENGLASGEQKVRNIVTKNVVAILHWKNGIKVGKQQDFDPATGNLIDESHTDEEGKTDGEVFAKTPDGVVYYKAQYSHGKKDGLEQTFDKATGKPLRQAGWKSGTQDGSVKEWDTEGRLKVDALYRDGTMISENAQVAADREAENFYQSCMKLAVVMGTVFRDGKPVSPSERQADCAPQAQAVRAKALISRNIADSGEQKGASQAACVKRWIDAYMRDPMNVGVADSQIKQWEGFCSQGKEPS